MLVIDARKLQDAGIGTYVRQLVPRVLERLPRVDCTLWLAPGGEAWAAEVQARAGGRVIGRPLDARPLGMREQLVLRRALGPRQLLWVTSLSHPLFFRGPMIATVHDVAQVALPPELAGGRVTRVAARVFLQSLRNCARELIFDSEFSRDEFSRLIGAPHQPATVVPLAADPGWFDARNLGDRPQARPYFISVSSVRPHKNFGFLVRAFAAVADRLPQQLVLVGDTQGQRTVDGQLAGQVAQWPDRVQFLGRLPETELRRWVAHADAIVFPSLYEGFGLPPLEALAAGCPVLCSTAGALREVCGDAAQYFDPRNSASLQEGLVAHATLGPQARAEQVARGIMRARTFDWERTADLTAAVVERALGRRPRL